MDDDFYNRMAILIAVISIAFGLACVALTHIEVRKRRREAEHEVRRRAEHERMMARLASNLPEHCDIWTSKTDAKKEKHAA